jgi:hypothetical protein
MKHLKSAWQLGKIWVPVWVPFCGPQNDVLVSECSYLYVFIDIIWCVYILYIYACLIYAFCNAASHVYDYIIYIYMVLLKLCYIIFITICICVYMVLYLYVATCTYCFAYTCIHMYCIVIHLPNRGTAYSVSFAIIIHTRSVYIRYIYTHYIYICNPLIMFIYAYIITSCLNLLYLTAPHHGFPV